MRCMPTRAHRLGDFCANGQRGLRTSLHVCSLRTHRSRGRYAVACAAGRSTATGRNSAIPETKNVCACSSNRRRPSSASFVPRSAVVERV